MRWSWPFTRKTYWEDMDDLTWLNYVIRNVHRVRSNGESEDEDMLICNVALHGHFTCEFTVGNLEQLIERGQRYEALRLVWKGRKRKWRLRWRW